MKVLKSFPHFMEAELMVSFLKASGIDAVMLDAHTSAIAPFYLGVNNVRVGVPDEQLYKARELLDEVERSGVSPEED